MIYRNQVFVRAVDPNGKWGACDVLDLEEESFRAFVIGVLCDRNLAYKISDNLLEGERLQLRSRVVRESNE